MSKEISYREMRSSVVLVGEPSPFPENNTTGGDHYSSGSYLFSAMCAAPEGCR